MQRSPVSSVCPARRRDRVRRQGVRLRRFRAASLSSPLGLDVCSLGELVTAERAGFPPDAPDAARRRQERRRTAGLVRRTVAPIAVDGIAELRRYATLSRDGSAAVLLRSNTGVEATPRIRPDRRRRHKFGIHPRDEAPQRRSSRPIRNCNSSACTLISARRSTTSRPIWKTHRPSSRRPQRLAAFGLQSERGRNRRRFRCPPPIPKAKHEQLDVTADHRRRSIPSVRSAAQETRPSA